MEINRNQYFALGIVILLIGIQFRHIESFTLNKESSTLIRQKMQKIKGNDAPALATTNSSFNDFFYSAPII